MIMKCGCRPQGTSRGKPACVVHLCYEVAENQPDLSQRKARCACGEVKPSSDQLPFFEYRGPGSPDALQRCVNCGYYEVAHSHEADHMKNRKTVIEDGRCKKGFELNPNGREFDSFYCGHAGWD